MLRNLALATRDLSIHEWLCGCVVVMIGKYFRFKLMEVLSYGTWTCPREFRMTRTVKDAW